MGVAAAEEEEDEVAAEEGVEADGEAEAMSSRKALATRGWRGERTSLISRMRPSDSHTQSPWWQRYPPITEWDRGLIPPPRVVDEREEDTGNSPIWRLRVKRVRKRKRGRERGRERDLEEGEKTGN